MNYKITFENGMTVIKCMTEVKKKSNLPTGVQLRSIKGHHKYAAYIVVQNKKYYLDRSDDLESMIALRKEAEKHRENGTFFEWRKTYATEAKRRRAARSKK